MSVNDNSVGSPPCGKDFAGEGGSAIEALVSLSEAMLDVAGAGEWQQLVELEAKRRPLLEAFFSAWNNSPEKKVDAETVCTFIQAVQAIDKKVLALAETRKAETAKTLGDLKNAHQAASAYLENAQS